MSQNYTKLKLQDGEEVCLKVERSGMQVFIHLIKYILLSFGVFFVFMFIINFTTYKDIAKYSYFKTTVVLGLLMPLIIGIYHLSYSIYITNKALIIRQWFLIGINKRFFFDEIDEYTNKNDKNIPKSYIKLRYRKREHKLRAFSKQSIEDSIKILSENRKELLNSREGQYDHSYPYYKSAKKLFIKLLFFGVIFYFSFFLISSNRINIIGEYRSAILSIKNHQYGELFHTSNLLFIVMFIFFGFISAIYFIRFMFNFVYRPHIYLEKDRIYIPKTKYVFWGEEIMYDKIETVFERKKNIALKGSISRVEEWIEVKADGRKYKIYSHFINSDLYFNELLDKLKENVAKYKEDKKMEEDSKLIEVSENVE